MIAPEAYDSLDRYMNWISKFPQLSSDEQKEIFSSILLLTDSEEDLIKKEELENKLTQSNLLLVVSCAKKFDRHKQTGIPIMDLISAGNKGLTKAVQYYDVNNKTKANFCSYSYNAIIRFIHREFNRHDIVRVPRNHRIDKSKILRHLKDKKDISNELAQRMALTDKIEYKTIDSFIADHLEDKCDLFTEEIFVKDLRAFLMSKMGMLSKRQRQIVQMVYLSGEYRHPSEVAYELGITRQAVFRHVDAALQTLKAHMNVIDYKREKVS